MTAAIDEYCRERAVQLTRAGLSARQIADAVGISSRSVHRIRTASQVSQAGAAMPLTDDELATAARLLDDGCSYNEVARTLGRSSTVFRKRFPGHGWPPGEGARLAQLQRWAKYRAARLGVSL